ncbi:hypothetical protein ILUMI_25676 [Ignelater luminosus]|uniref:N-acyl-aliphatic-L-amino acid amidohydrolase n=1 Tax=Ignelater luminosus TaxID=2038154 RepID=A0A8K0C4K1_IGNLU|nr:hypothetical protein ILUMI_25676 [Ignelater luminosus]
MGDLNQVAVENFRQYLQIPSVHPNVNYDGCVAFLENQARGLGLPISTFYFVPKKPVVIITWKGNEPHLPSIMLNGHMDVVPAYEDEWTHDPFGAEMDDKGNIYARGAQDMKCVSIQYLETIRRMRKDNVTLKRTIHISFVPDEEIGGFEGMKPFVESKEFRKLNVGFILDEGSPSSDNVLPLYYGERTRWAILIHCPGQPGHGSLLLDNTAGEKVKKILDKFYEFRDHEKKRIEEDPNITDSDVTSVNLTIMKGGVQNNIIPPEFTLSIDCRIAITVDLEQFEATLNKWCKEAGEGVWIEYQQKDSQVPPTKLDESNPYWIAFKKAASNINLQLKPQIMGGMTDSRYVRALDIPALGFSPMSYTTRLAHAHNEYLNKDVFLRGIEIYRQLLTAVASVEDKGK